MLVNEVVHLFSTRSERINPSHLAGYKLNQCYHGDCVVEMRNLANNSIDLIIADPPFAIDFIPRTSGYNRSKGNVLSGYVEIKYDNYELFTQKWIKEAARVVSKTGTIIIVSGWSNMYEILGGIRNAGLNIINHIVFRYNFGEFTHHKFVSAHYCIFVCSLKKKHTIFNKLLWYMEDVMESDDDEKAEIWQIPREYWTNKVKTPTKLPKELIEMLIAVYSLPKSIIIDPFSGAGTVLKVCSYMNRDCIAFDLQPTYVDFANHRLANLAY